MQQLHEQHNKQLKTIVLSQENYQKLKGLGFTGESFNTVVGRLLDKVNEEDI